MKDNNFLIDVLLLKNCKLSPREEEILQLLYQGHSYKTVSKLLGISSKTVSTHATKIFRSLQCNNKAEAIYKYIKIKELKENKKD